MSYSGYDQYLCEDGHYWEADALYSFGVYDNDPYCHLVDCGKPIVWTNSVDTTNDDGKPVAMEILQEAVLCTCCACLHIHVVEAERYKLPPEGQGRRL